MRQQTVLVPVTSDWPYGSVPNWPYGFHGVYKSLAQALGKLEQGLDPNQVRVLQVGIGPTTVYLTAQGLNIIGVDSDPEALAWVGRELERGEFGGCVRLVECEAQSFWPRQQFHLITSDIAVYVLCSEMRKLIKRWQTCLLPGGIIDLQFKTYQDSSFAEVEYFGGGQIEPGTYEHYCAYNCPYTHMSFWSPEEVLALFRGNKELEVIYFAVHTWQDDGQFYTLGSPHIWSVCQICVQRVI